MAPKSTRSSSKKRQSLALVVSTPTMVAGQKRKAQSDVVKEKSKKKMGESSLTHYMERDPLYILEDRDKERVDLDNEIVRIPKPVSDEYNENILKRMGYELKGNQWTPKPSKKIREESSSKGKEPMESERPKVEGFEVEMRAFMVQMSDSMKLLHTKVDNMAFRLVIVEKKMRNLTREVQKGKIPMEEDESEEEQEEENEDEEQNNNDGDNEEKARQKGGEDSDQEKNYKYDSSETKSDASPILIRKKSQRLGRLSKFSNTATTALELSPSPSFSPSTPIHALHASISHTTSPLPPI
ncbi:hypothetical protein Acr_13g0015970 [Actinidia rufa]|uniref:Uncharacterized protein n=1 Tax=Actinidia rufa TaxID=165716 RepID=A0A7J0FQJ9_9ERIC|nr:hypothetical protein Acr_13g0015970 [Actinidia rufa]